MNVNLDFEWPIRFSVLSRHFLAWLNAKSNPYLSVYYLSLVYYKSTQYYYCCYIQDSFIVSSSSSSIAAVGELALTVSFTFRPWFLFNYHHLHHEIFIHMRFNLSLLLLSKLLHIIHFYMLTTNNSLHTLLCDFCAPSSTLSVLSQACVYRCVRHCSVTRFELQ